MLLLSKPNLSTSARRIGKSKFRVCNPAQFSRAPEDNGQIPRPELREYSSSDELLARSRAVYWRFLASGSRRWDLPGVTQHQSDRLGFVNLRVASELIWAVCVSPTSSCCRTYR